MGLITGLLTLPLAPVRGVMWIAEQVQEQAESQWSDPAAIQAALEAVETQRETGEITDDEADAQESMLLDRLAASHSADGYGGWHG